MEVKGHNAVDGRRRMDVWMVTQKEEWRRGGGGGGEGTTSKPGRRLDRRRLEGEPTAVGWQQTAVGGGTDGGRIATDGGWRGTDGGWMAIDGGRRGTDGGWMARDGG